MNISKKLIISDLLKYLRAGLAGPAFINERMILWELKQCRHQNGVKNIIIL